MARQERIFPGDRRVSFVREVFEKEVEVAGDDHSEVS